MCGVDGFDGGIAMLAIGGLMLAGLAYARARPEAHAARLARHARLPDNVAAIAPVFPLGLACTSLYLIVAGAWCVHTDGAEKCGPAGYGGGVAMVVIGVALPMYLLHVA
jgi:hypothetical protein